MLSNFNIAILLAIKSYFKFVSNERIIFLEFFTLALDANIVQGIISSKYLAMERNPQEAVA